ncbi:MAG: hypothetical protein WC494_01090 [Candidatus Pacearchaeota archaeon]
MKGGLGVLEGILGSLDEAEHHKRDTRREIVRGSDVRVRKVMRVGNVLAVQEISLSGTKIRPEDLKGEKIENPIFSRSYFRSPDNISHLYELFEIGPYDKDLVLDYNRAANSIFRVSTTFDSVCRDLDHSFTEQLKPVISYAIITPIMSLQFPSYAGIRSGHCGYTTPTDGTMVVTNPFKIKFPTDNYIEMFSNTTSNESANPLPDLISDCNLSERVIKVVDESPEFHSLTQHFVDLSKKIDEVRQEEHRKEIRL